MSWRKAAHPTASSFRKNSSSPCSPIFPTSKLVWISPTIISSMSKKRLSSFPGMIVVFSSFETSLFPDGGSGSALIPDLSCKCPWCTGWSFSQLQFTGIVRGCGLMIVHSSFFSFGFTLGVPLAKVLRFHESLVIIFLLKWVFQWFLISLAVLPWSLPAISDHLRTVGTLVDQSIISRYEHNSEH